ncbi:MAG: alkaline phosphatase family protein [Propionibacteriaceae bacterium]
MSLVRTRLAAMPIVALLLSSGAVAQSYAAPPLPVPVGAVVAASGSPIAPAAASASRDDAVNKVLAISIDGLNPSAITKLGPKGAPTFYRLMREGSFTLNARTEREQTRTLPNHTGMLTSRRIDDQHGGHGVTYNSDRGKTVHQAAGHYVSSVFDVVHDRGGSTALYTAKEKFKIYQRTWNTKGAKDKTGVNNGRKKIDRFVVDENNARLVAKLNTQLGTAPRVSTYTFLHISLPDVYGHKYGFMSAKYLTAVKATDVLLGRVLNTVSRRPALKKQLLVVLTADHGGYGASHSKATSLQNFRVPFMAWGPGVPAGRNLYSINPAFKDPKTARTSYRGKQPIRNGDVANLSTDALDLPKVPGSELNSSRKLTVFGR